MEICWPIFQTVSYCTQKEERTSRNKEESILIRKVVFFFFSLSINGLWKSLAGNDSTFLLCCWKGPISTSRCHNGWGWIWLFLVSTRYTRCERTKRPRPKWEMAKGPLSIAFWIQSLELFLKRRNASWASRGVRISSRKLGVSLKLRAREETDVLYFFFSKSFRK